MLNLKQNFPDKPGCYIMKDVNNKILYIGKAKSLKKRVSWYYNARKNNSINCPYNQKTKKLIRQINKIEYIITSNELDALVLESQLIRQHKPYFNIDLKENSRYTYLQFTKEIFPRLTTTRKIEPGQKNNYFGPFTESKIRYILLYWIYKIFKLRRCFKFKKNACLYYHMNKCCAPCINNVSQQEYRQRVKNARLLLKGNTDKLKKMLVTKMQKYSERKKYEKAAEIRDQIKVLKKYSGFCLLNKPNNYNEDIINYVKYKNKIFIGILNVKKGVIFDKKEYQFDFYTQPIEEFIKQYYFYHNTPDRIIIPQKLNDQINITKFIALKSNKKPRFHIPIKGDKKKLLKLVKKNLIYSNKIGDQDLVKLKEILNLKEIPAIIECFDISNIANKYITGSEVRFLYGKPDKNNYRRFKIKKTQKQNDFAAISEVVRRRYERLLKESKTLPHLIVVDGGMGQLNAAKKELIKLNINTPVISLAKKNEEIYLTNKKRPLKINKNNLGIKFLRQIRDEAHRFAIKYHRTLRSNQFLK